MSAGRVITRLVRVTIPGIAGSVAGVPAERRDPVTGNYVRVTGLAGLFAEARELSVRTMIFDVEPLVAPWHGSQESLDQGVARTLGDVRTVSSVRVVVFATNSARRRPPSRPARAFRSGTWHPPRSRCGPRRTTTFPGRAPWQVISSPPTGYSPTGWGLRSCTTRRNWPAFRSGPRSCIAGASWCARCCSGGRPPTGNHSHGVAVSHGIGPARQPDRASSPPGRTKRADRAGSRYSGWPAGGVRGCQGDAKAHVGDRRQDREQNCRNHMNAIGSPSSPGPLALECAGGCPQRAERDAGAAEEAGIGKTALLDGGRAGRRHGRLRQTGPREDQRAGQGAHRAGQGRSRCPSGAGRRKAGQAAGRPQSQWQSVKADAQAKMRDLQDRIGRKRDELDVKAAEQDAEGVEDDAIDALDLAEWVAEQAEVAVLDAINARAWADERAAASRTS